MARSTIDPEIIESIRKKYFVIKQVLDERSRRIWVASEALSLGRGGITAVVEATSVDDKTISRGIKEIKNSYENQEPLKLEEKMRSGKTGRKKATDKDLTLRKDLLDILEDNTRGDPMSLLKWTSKSTTNLADELNKDEYRISPTTVREILKEEKYSLQANKKTIEGKSSHPDRDEQFKYINDLSKEFQEAKQPVISVDTKKKENLGLLKNNGKEWRPKGDPRKVKDHDFPDKELGKAIPYGIYDVANNDGFVNVGVDHDTAEFAVQSIKNWWKQMGIKAYPEATKVLITADCGGSNRPTARLWKKELQKLANELNLEIHICHFPPGTSKWNKIEHRMFSHISMNWSGQPLVSHEVVVNLIGATKTKKGLSIQSFLDKGEYKTGIKIDKKDLEKVNLIRKDFHGDWNYSIEPQEENYAVAT